jgi:AraC-like DNA-binding protein
MATSSSSGRVRVPPGGRDWLLPLADPRARPLHGIDVVLVGISEVRRGFDWPGPGARHLVLGTIAGEGSLEAGGQRLTPREGDLVVSPAGLARRYATRAARWKFLAIRLADTERWRSLRDRGVRPIPGHWLRRLLPAVDGMLAEHPLGSAVPSHTQRSHAGGESPADYLRSRYADRLFDGGVEEAPEGPRADPFELHATILRHQIEGMLRERPDAELDGEAVVLESLWSRVVEEPRGPWDAEALASALGVSRTGLYRMVKRQHGTSPGRVVERLRMDEACRLLSESRHSIQVVADQVGYASAFSFSAAFKRSVGKSPSRFRLDPATRVPRP